ncbi:arginine decarboxylase, pyruvoyl-dependent [Dehalococcoidia bacterium]|nr:arginine decarboxylase, pyruvoyl-dependent [Dehalococcoidia bacterium]
MWEVPNTVVFFQGSAEGENPLNAFDNALLDAGVGHLNLLKVSSVVPPGAKIANPSDCEIKAACQPGAIVPCVMTSFHSSQSGEIISACIGVGLPIDAFQYGMIYEYASVGDQAHTVEVVKNMINSALAIRNVKIGRVITECGSHEVLRMGCVVALALLLRL